MAAPIVNRMMLPILLFTVCSQAPVKQEAKLASVTVRVADANGSLISNAIVRVSAGSSETELEKTVDDMGVATMNVLPGTHDLTVTSPGFMRLVLHGVEIKPGEHREFNVVLKVPPPPSGPNYAPPIFELERAKLGDLVEPHPFPEIHDWNSLRIALHRSGCYGKCPAYDLEIHGDGTVFYDGKANVKIKGKRTGKISQASMSELVDVFRKAGYFSLADRYASGVTDYPTYVSSISFDGVSKSVLDYAGRSIGMPSTVTDVEAAIDRLAVAHKWVGRKSARF